MGTDDELNEVEQPANVVPVAKTEWPVHFPARGCPPASARAVNEPVFRRCNGDGNDWKSALELGLYPKKPAWRRAALSAYIDLIALRETLAVHEDWPARKIVKADLNASHGKIQQTGIDPAHHSLWLTRSALAACDALFVGVDE